MFPSRLDRCIRIAALALALTLPRAVSAQEQTGRAAPDPKDPALAPRGPLVRAAAPARPTVPMRLRSKPATATTKAEHFTDAGLDQPATELTARERAKLEAARVAVAAARAAGGPSNAPLRALDLATPLHAIEAGERDKFERLRLAQPSPVASEPGKSGLPTVLQSRQKQGAKEPTARELEKLKAKPTSSVTPETKKETER